VIARLLVVSFFWFVALTVVVDAMVGDART
jgi:hypothetical protein